MIYPSFCSLQFIVEVDGIDGYEVGSCTKLLRVNLFNYVDVGVDENNLP